MKRIFRHPFVLFSLCVLFLYFFAEIIIRGESLNRISSGIVGWLFWIGIGGLVFWGLILPVIQFASFPVWRDPSEIENITQRIRYLRRYSDFLLSNFGRNPDPAIAGSMEKLKITVRNTKGDPAAFLAEAEPLVVQIHKDVSEKVCGKIIHDYMKKTALIVMLSQRGWFDAAGMLVMQIRLVSDLSKALGQRPTWISLSGCMFWVVANSFFFALFDGTDFVEEAASEMFPLVLGENVVKGIPFLPKVMDIVVQGAASMAVVYATGKIVQAHLLERKNKLSSKERIKYRIDGYKEAVGMTKDFALSKLKISSSGVQA